MHSCSYKYVKNVYKGLLEVDARVSYPSTTLAGLLHVLGICHSSNTFSKNSTV